jgi:hypothetical protein
MSTEKYQVSEVCPPHYTSNEVVGETRYTKKSKALFGYAVAVTTALVVVLVLGGVYYYKSIDNLQEVIEKFRVVDDSGKTPVTQDIEINTAKQYAVVQINGDSIAPGTYAVLDYSKSMTGIYEPNSRRCYLIAGIQNRIVDLETIRHYYEKQNGTSNKGEVRGETFYYVVADTYPVSDKTILSAPLKTSCASLPVYWLEPATDDTHDRVKREKCWEVEVGWGKWKIKYRRCK